ncbi:MAG: hypothetical protein NUV64_02925 [Parcubacteria group bacterium]|nr:hypothetical protein [Parcubacteria group bacterium]MCR4342967.1 hypothetical protein [Patescibacteria group bacterium]
MLTAKDTQIIAQNKKAPKFLGFGAYRNLARNFVFLKLTTTFYDLYPKWPRL